MFGSNKQCSVKSMDPGVDRLERQKRTSKESGFMFFKRKKKDPHATTSKEHWWTVLHWRADPSLIGHWPFQSYLVLNRKPSISIKRSSSNWLEIQSSTWKNRVGLRYSQSEAYLDRAISPTQDHWNMNMKGSWGVPLYISLFSHHLPLII